MASAVLNISKLSKTFLTKDGPLSILNEIDLVIEAGEILAIQGPSGCGKSTLISLIAGLDGFNSGLLEVLGHTPLKMSASDWNSFRARNIGIIFQQFNLLEHLTAFENIRLPLDLAGVSDADERTTEALMKVGLIDRKNHFQRELSRGESQRVAIARVLVMKPKLILADEPTASLDQKTGKDISQMIFKLARLEKIAALVVTHDASIADLCDRTFNMKEGKLYSKLVQN